MAAEIKAKFEGKWKIYKQENYEAYLDASGLEPFERRMALAIKPVMKLKVEGETITTKIKAGAIKNKTSFRLGEEYELSVLGNVYKGVTTWSDGKLKAHVTSSDPRRTEQFIDREIVRGEMVVSLTAGGAMAKQYFKKVQPKTHKQSK